MLDIEELCLVIKSRKSEADKLDFFKKAFSKYNNGIEIENADFLNRKEEEILLQVLAENGNIEVMQFLVDEVNMEVSFKLNDKNENIFDKALNSRNCKLINFLLSKTSDDLKDILLNTQNTKGKTSLHKVVQYNDCIIVKLFLNEIICDARVKDGRGNNILHLAIEILSLKMVDCIFSETSDGLQYELINSKNKQKQTPIDLILEGIKLTIKYEAGKILINKNKQELLIKLFEFLIKTNKCDLTIIDKSCNSSFDIMLNNNVTIEDSDLKKFMANYLENIYSEYSNNVEYSDVNKIIETLGNG